MTVPREWRQALARASGATLIVPASLLAALAVLGFAGGFAGIASLRQAFAGPGLPNVPNLTAAGAAATVGFPAPARAGARTGAPHAGSRGVGAAAPARRRPVPTAPSGPAAPIVHPTAGSSATAAPGGTSGPPARPGPVRGTLETVVKSATSVTSQVPGEPGSVATQAVETAGATIDRLSASIPTP